MARGHIGGGWRGFQIDPIDFSRGGGGDNRDMNAMAMEIMGYGKGESQQDRALAERQQAAKEMYESGQLANLAETRRIQEAGQKSEAEARTSAAARATQQDAFEAQREATRQKELADSLTRARETEGRATAKGLLDTMVKEGRITVGSPDYNRLAERSMPGYGEESKQIAQADRERKIAEGVTKYQKATPKERQAYAKTPASLSPDLYDEILKQAGVNVAQPGAPAAAPGEGQLPLSSLNAPVAPPSDVFSEQGVRIGPPIVDARDYGAFPGSVEDLIAASRGSMQARGGQVIPEQMFPNRPVAAPPLPLNDLLAKALQNQ